MSTEYIYSDFDMLMGMNIKNDIAKKYDINSIKQSVKNIVMTRDRCFYPEWGPRISTLLFEPDNPFTRNLITDEIKIAIAKYEPRVKNCKVEYIAGQDTDHEMFINIIFQVINSIEWENVSIILEKIK
jgi:phage baseplate assembly protein W